MQNTPTRHRNFKIICLRLFYATVVFLLFANQGYTHSGYLVGNTQIMTSFENTNAYYTNIENIAIFDRVIATALRAYPIIP